MGGSQLVGIAGSGDWDNLTDDQLAALGTAFQTGEIDESIIQALPEEDRMFFEACILSAKVFGSLNTKLVSGNPAELRHDGELLDIWKRLSSEEQAVLARIGTDKIFEC